LKHSFIDQYSDMGSFIHKLDPRTKFITIIVFLLAVLVTPISRWQAFTLYFALVAILIILSRVPLLYVLKRSFVIVPFVLVIAALNIPFKNGEAISEFDIWLWRVSITREGLLVFGNIIVKAWLSILGLILLSSTTPLIRLLKGMEQLGLPRVMVMIISFMYRYIFVLTDEVMRMKQARDSRNFGGKWLWQIKTIGNMIGTIFIRSYERAERVHAAMLSRGFEGQVRTASSLQFKKADAYFATLIIACLFIIGCFPLLDI
jgi:cobalt/nickel transport system permease protein